MDEKFREFSELRELNKSLEHELAVADPGGPRGPYPLPPRPVKISHKKDGGQIWLHRFHVSRPPPLYPAAGSATDWTQFKDPVSPTCLAGTVVVSWSLTQEVAGSNNPSKIYNIFYH